MNISATDPKGPVRVWVANLSVTSLPVLVAVFLRHGRFALHYTAARRDGLAVAWFLRLARVLVSKAQYVRFSLNTGQWHDPEKGYGQIFAVVNQFVERFFDTHNEVMERFEYPDNRVRSDRVLANLKKSAAQTTNDLVEFLGFARQYHRSQGQGPRRLVMVTPAAVLANAVPPGWAGDDVDFICPWNRQDSLILHLGRAISRCLAGSLRPRRSPRVLPPSVAVEAAWRLDPKEKLNALFWWWDSGIAPERIVHFFERASEPASGERMAQAQDLGIRCVVLNPKAAGDSPHLLWHAAPGPALSMLRLWQTLRALTWGLRQGTEGRWIACRVTNMLHRSEIFADFLVEFNVRAVLESQDSGMDYVSLACDAAGAARIGYHWSHTDWPIAYHERLHQVYFAWGPQHVKVMEAAGSCVDHVLLAGCIVRGAHADCNELVDLQDQRDMLAANGASRVIALFDRTLAAEGFYEFFLRKVIQDPRWGLLIKPKNPYLPWHRRDLPELQGLSEQATATGRATFLNFRLSPSDAAAVADFAVGVDISSAVVVAGLAGHRAIHLDYIDHTKGSFAQWSDFNRAGQDRLVFNDPEKLWASLNHYFDEPDSDTHLGLLDEPLLSFIDPFRDGQAGKRVGQYVGWYLEAIEQGLERDPALAQATCLYANEWGEGSVAKGFSGANSAPLGPEMAQGSPSENLSAISLEKPD